MTKVLSFVVKLSLFSSLVLMVITSGSVTQATDSEYPLIVNLDVGGVGCLEVVSDPV